MKNLLHISHGHPRRAMLLGLAFALVSASGAEAQLVRRQTAAAVVEAASRQRLIVLTDIEADPDDAQSLIRLLLYSGEIDIEGLIATTSMFQKDRVAPEEILRILDAYHQVWPNLIKHQARYPSAKLLASVVSTGPKQYGMTVIGPGQLSLGAEAIIKALKRSDTRPLWIAIWGGPNTLAQALWYIRSNEDEKTAERLYRKLRVYAISDQDDSGPWIRKTFPSVWYTVSPSPTNATWRAMAGLFKGSSQEMVSAAWLAKNIQQGHGPLGAAYPDTAYGMEGDTPSFLHLIPNGLNVPERPDWGGWGGRYEHYIPTLSSPASGAGAQIDFRIPETRPIWTNAEDQFPPAAAGRRAPFAGDPVKDNYVTLWRWREDVQNDFAGRMAWATKSFSEANHAPIVHIQGPDQFAVRSGETFKLDARGSTDPDGDSLTYLWFQYPEAGSYKATVSFGSLAPNLANVHTIVAPSVQQKETIHFIVKVTDKGNPPMSSYRRVIVTVLP